MSDSNKKSKSWALTFADAPTIIQAHQKDEQIETILSVKVTELLRGLKGQLFVNSFPKEVSVLVKLLYLGLTTLTARRTLGEEYVDLVYVSRKGDDLVRTIRRGLFVVGYAVGPFLIPKLYKKYYVTDEENDDNDTKKELSRTDVINTMLDLHLVLFYFTGTYYDVFKRIFGMRYAIGHRLSDEEKSYRERSSRSYKILGYILLLQHISKVKPLLKKITARIYGQTSKSHSEKNSQSALEGQKEKNDFTCLTDVPDGKEIEHIDLNNEETLQYIPRDSRGCILCLTNMTDPSCLPCGHVFCWECITDWTKENPECPICRQKSYPQQVLALRSNV